MYFFSASSRAVNNDCLSMLSGSVIRGRKAYLLLFSWITNLTADQTAIVGNEFICSKSPATSPEGSLIIRAICVGKEWGSTKPVPVWTWRHTIDIDTLIEELCQCFDKMIGGATERVMRVYLHANVHNVNVFVLIWSNYCVTQLTYSVIYCFS